jgi:hypothetical protein
MNIKKYGTTEPAEEELINKTVWHGKHSVIFIFVRWLYAVCFHKLNDFEPFLKSNIFLFVCASFVSKAIWRDSLLSPVLVRNIVYSSDE